MGNIREDARHQEFMNIMNKDSAKASEGLFSNGRTEALLGRHQARIETSRSFWERTKARVKTASEIPEYLANKTGDVASGTGKVTGKTVKGTGKVISKLPGFKLAGYAALGAVGLAGLAYFANSGKKKVSADDVTPADSIAMADFDAAPLPEIPTNTLMGLQPVEGEHVSRLGKGGQQLSFQDVAPPRDMTFEDVSTVPVR